MVELVIRDNIKEFTRDLNIIQRQQIPFATSRAINDTAVDAQGAVVTRVQRIFDNRKKWWVKGNRRTGIRVKFSNKRNLTSAVYTEAYFADLQEDGGIKRPRGSKLAVPTKKAPRRLYRSTGVRDAKQNHKVFSDRRGVFQRMARNRLKMLFSWTSAASVSPRLGFEKTARARATASFRRNFERRLKQALATARP